MAKENNLPFLQSSDKGFHTKIIEDLGDKYKCFNSSTKQEVYILKELATFVFPEMVSEFNKNKHNESNN